MDKRMTAKEYLEQAYRLDQRINAKLEQIMQLRSLSQRYTVAFGGEYITYSKCFFYGGRCHKDCHAIVGYSSVFTMDHDICVKQDSHTGSPFNPTGSSTLRHRYQ